MKKSALESAVPETLTLATVADERKEKISELVTKTDISDSTEVVQFGTGVQTRLSSFTNSILAEVQIQTAHNGGELLNQLLTHIKSVELGLLGKYPGFLATFPLIGTLFNRYQKFVGQFQSVSANIDQVSDKLSSTRQELLRDIAKMDSLYERNVDYFKDLETYIAAGERILEVARNETLPALKEDTGDALAAQKYRDFEQSLTRFEKRVHDLKLSKTVALQTLPQIRLVQAGNQELAEKIQSSILNTIPLWKNQIVLGISIMKQKKAVELQKKVSDTTNELLTKNSEMLKQGATEIAQESERGVVDIETIRKVNQDLISTVEDVIKIQAEGRQKRAAVEKELITIESELKTRLLEAKGTENKAE